MADERIVNGVASDDHRTVEIGGKEDLDDLFVDVDDGDNKVSDSNLRIAALEQEKAELARENRAIGDGLEKLKGEIGGLEKENAAMRREIGQSGEDKRALEAIAARAAQLEAEVSRLQHDLISTSTAAEDANAELSDLRRLVEELEKSDSEKGSRVEVLDRERSLLLERLELEARVLAESRAEAESRIAEKEGEIRQLKKRAEEMDSAGMQKGLEIERLKKEREELEIVKNETEALLKKSERKVKEMENKTKQLQSELEAAEKMISGLKENAGIDGLNGIEGYVDRAVVEDGEEGLKLQWPIIAASAGALAAVAVVYYVRYGRQR